MTTERQLAETMTDEKLVESLEMIADNERTEARVRTAVFIAEAARRLKVQQKEITALESAPLCGDHAETWYTRRPTIVPEGEEGCVFCDSDRREKKLEEEVRILGKKIESVDASRILLEGILGKFLNRIQPIVTFLEAWNASSEAIKKDDFLCSLNVMKPDEARLNVRDLQPLLELWNEAKAWMLGQSDMKIDFFRDAETIADLKKKLLHADSNVQCLLELWGKFYIRVCEGGGPEDIYASLAVSGVQLLREAQKAATVRSVIGLLRRSSCWCEAGIDNPNARGQHSDVCKAVTKWMQE